MNTIDLVKREFDSMPLSEQRVASFFLGNLNRFAFSTLDSLASEIGTSTTSVIRFCRKVGFTGYKGFQEALRSEIMCQPSLPVKFERAMSEFNGNDLLAQTIQQNIHCLEKTFIEMSASVLDDAVSRICSARRVFTFGLKESVALSHYAFTRFMTVRKDVFMLNANNGCVEAIHNLSPDDICTLFLFHRYTRETIRLLPLIKKTRTQVLLITNPPYENISMYADLILPCYMDAHGIKNTSVAPICLLDYLCNAIALRQGDEAISRMRQLEELIQTSELLGS